VDLDLTVLDLQAGDRYLLCSDGLSGFVPFNTVASTLAGYGDPHHAAETLIQHALRGGGADNITCIVADAYEQAPPGSRPPSQAETQYLELPVVVGAAAENQANNLASYTSVSSKPGADPADPGVTGVIPATAPGTQSAEPSSQGSKDHGDTAELEAVQGDPEPRRRRRWVRPTLVAGTCVVVLAGLAAGGYYWTQQQYYVGADGANVAIYRGVHYSLAGLDLSHVYSAEPVTVAGLPSPQRSRVDSSITATSLTDAQQIVSTLSTQETECAALEAAPVNSTTPASTPSAPASPTGTAAKSTAKATSPGATGKASTTKAASPHSSVSPSDSPSPTTTPAPSVTPSSSVGSGSADLHQLSAQCPGGTS
jgi:protein phosphatase